MKKGMLVENGSSLNVISVEGIEGAGNVVRIVSYTLKEFESQEVNILNLTDYLEALKPRLENAAVVTPAPETSILAKRPVASKVSPIIYRYIRMVWWDPSVEKTVIDNLGGVTIAARIHYDVQGKDLLELGISVCSETDNFEKELGKRLAVDRLLSESFYTPYNGQSGITDSETIIETVIRLYKDNALPRNIQQAMSYFHFA